MNRVAKQGGFTLIELLLAMSFISVLLLAIAMTIIQISQIYNRGMTLKEVNQSARSISDELKRNISNTEQFDLDTSYVPLSSGGRLCTGTFSYIWNTRKAISENDPNVTTNGGVPVRLAKVQDIAGLYCAKDSEGELQLKSVATADKDKVTEILNVGDHDLSLHKFIVSSEPNAADEVTGQQLYTIDFTIGTSDLDALDDTQTTCKAPNLDGSDLAYCSVQNFSLVIRAGNRVN